MGFITIIFKCKIFHASSVSHGHKMTLFFEPRCCSTHPGGVTLFLTSTGLLPLFAKFCQLHKFCLIFCNFTGCILRSSALQRKSVPSAPFNASSIPTVGDCFGKKESLILVSMSPMHFVVRFLAVSGHRRVVIVQF